MNKLIERYKAIYGIELRILPIPWAVSSYIINMYYPDGMLFSAVLKESEIAKDTQENINLWMKSKDKHVEG